MERLTPRGKFQLPRSFNEIYHPTKTVVISTTEDPFGSPDEIRRRLFGR